MTKQEAELLCLFSDFTPYPKFDAFAPPSKNIFLSNIEYGVKSSNPTILEDALLNLNWDCPGQEFWKTEFVLVNLERSELSSRALTQIEVWKALR